MPKLITTILIHGPIAEQNKKTLFSYLLICVPKLVVFLHKGEVIRGKALAFHENVLKIKSEEVIHEIKVDEIRDIFSVKKGE